MSLANSPVTLLTAGLLALACARAPERTLESGLAAAGSISSQASASGLADAQPAPNEPGATAARSASIEAARAKLGAGEPEPEPAATADAVAARARKSPMQALSQVLTAQALLVSLLLAPLSKDDAADPTASVEPPPGPTR